MVSQIVSEQIDRYFKRQAAAYAERLLDHGFTVYVDPHNTRPTDGEPIPLDWFYYSREIDGKTYYGVFSIGYFGDADHSMPVKPSREYGSSIKIANAEMGDPFTVAAAEKIARPRNIGVHCDGRSFVNHKPFLLERYWVDIRTQGHL